MIQFKENAWTDGQKDGRTDGQKDGRMDEQTLFHRTLPASAGGPIISFETPNRDLNKFFLIYKKDKSAAKSTLANAACL